MRIFSTFSGIGGFEIGIQNAYRKKNGSGSSRAPAYNETDRQGLLTKEGKSSSATRRSSGSSNINQAIDGPLFVGWSEIDKYASAVYKKRFGGKNYGDITRIRADQLPEFECLVGGFPCQAFSIVGKRHGFEDTRGTLFFDLVRILSAKQPRLFVFENVKGLLSHDSGKTFKTIIATIDELGYDCQWQVLNSKDFGVPQNRERIIIVGHLRGTPRPKVFPITRTDKQTTRSDEVKIGTLRTHKDGNGFRQMKSGIAPTIPARARNDGSGQAVVLVPSIDRASTKRSVSHYESGIVPTIRATHYKSGDNQPKVLEPNTTIRRLTPLECERLQGFPDNWTAIGASGPISDTQRYKMCGNAVTTNVIEAVFERIIR